MQVNKIRLYILEILLFLILFTVLIVSNKISYILLAAILVLYTIVVKCFLKKRKITSIYKKQVMYLMIGFAIVYLALFYLVGFSINNFVRQTITFNFTTLYRFILPLITIIFTTEIIRFSCLSLDTKIKIFNKKVDISKIITFVNMVLVDLIIYTSVYDLSNYSDFLTVIGFTLFASVSCNLYYNYVSTRYGFFGIVCYRVITTIYVYFIPVVPNLYVYFRAFLRMIYPYLLYLILEHTYSKTDFVVSYRERKKNVLTITITLIVMVLITMLISCKFKYGVLVVGSESMTGAINKGDAVIYEKYDSNAIEEGTIIVFKKEDVRLIHRVVKAERFNEEIRYITKGDANVYNDDGYITNKDVIGVIKFRLVYLGYPTILLRSLFE